MVHVDTLEWQVSGPGTKEIPFRSATNDKSDMVFIWSEGSNSHARTRVQCISKGQGHGWNEIDTHVRRGAFPHELRPKQGQNQDNRDAIQ